MTITERSDWLAARRTAAAETAGSLELPSSSEEVWRYSRVGEINLADWGVAQADPDAGVPDGAARIIEAIGETAATVVVRNGAIVACETSPEARSAGLWVGPLAEAPDGEELLGSVSGQPSDVFGWLNEAHASSPVLVRVPDGLVVPAPLVVIDWVDTAAEGSIVASRLITVAGVDSEVSVVDWQGGDAETTALALPTAETHAKAAARVRITTVQDRPRRTNQIAAQAARAEDQATVRAAHAALGGDWSRTRTDCHLAGRGSHAELGAIYFGEASQSLDFRTFQEHLAPNTTSDLRYYGAVSGTSQAIYTGTIHIAPEGAGTEAHQTNRNLKLSDGAWAESVPNLEIENNDVQCSHASTVGPVDADQLFYLESRGVPTAVAEQLIVGGFFSDALSRLPEPAVADLVRAALAQRLERREW